MSLLIGVTPIESLPALIEWKNLFIGYRIHIPDDQKLLPMVYKLHNVLTEE